MVDADYIFTVLSLDATKRTSSNASVSRQDLNNAIAANPKQRVRFICAAPINQRAPTAASGARFSARFAQMFARFPSANALTK